MRSARSASSRSTRAIASAIAPAFIGSMSSAASPTTSGSDDTFDVMTGVPAAIASSGGRPKPS